MELRARDYPEALTAFEKIATDFQGTLFSEQAEVWKAVVYQRKGDTASAINAYEDFIKRYPQSEDVEYAQKQIAKLKGEDSTKK
ncbi:MAG TPA: outer membrane protein assembly factor BamD [Candidatus Deferrimicrobium sp.]|nr:outer membrane protein assembly factor BamD [Candidatus Deferrimicrobium sp.]